MRLGALLAVFGGAAGVGYLALRKREASVAAAAPTLPAAAPSLPPLSTYGKPRTAALPAPTQGHATMPGSFTPTLESWRPYFLIYGPDVSIDAAMAWTRIESGGNPCGIGSIPAAGHQPQEYGLAQLNAQDPSNLAIATPEALRGACAIGPAYTVPAFKGDPAAAAANAAALRAWQGCARPLTEAERIANANAALGLMRHCADKANAYLGRPAGMMASAWPVGWNLPDFWRLAKTYHASSAVANLFPAVAQSMGRQPTWDEFKAHANQIALSHHFDQDYLDRVWHNAEQIGTAVAAGMTTAPASS